MTTKSGKFLYILSLIGLFAVSTNILPQEISVGVENTLLSEQETLVHSFLQKSEFPIEQNTPSENFVNSSVIIGGSNLLTPAESDQIAGYLNEGEITLTKIFSKTSGDGKTAASFHLAADGKGRTITVLRVQYNGQQYLVGGYNPQSWSSIDNYNITADAARSAFIFNLTSNFVQRQKLNAEPNGMNGQYQTYNHTGYGPTFGNGNDLGIADFDLQSGNASNSSYGLTTNQNNILNLNVANVSSLQIIGLEVFTVASCSEFEYVGSYRVGDGPSWMLRPPTFTAKEAAAHLFGGNPQDYAISVNSSQDATTITHTAWLDGWGDTTYLETPAPEDFKRGELYNCTGCSFSAYVGDHLSVVSINYVWRRVACALNTAPSAAADTYATDEDAPLSIPPNGVLGNDTDGENNPLTAVLVSAPSNASSFMLNPDGSFGYVPDPDFNGTDSFTYKANDGQADSGAVTVTINVNPVNDAPSLSGVPDSATIDELAAYGFTASANDIDLPAQTLTYSLVGAPAGAGIDPSTGQFSWTPSEAQGDGSTYSFAVQVSDGVASTEAPVSLTVNEVNSAPVLDAIAEQTVDEQTLLSIQATAGDSDDPANTLTFSLATAPAGMTINSSTGSLSWTPTEEQGAGDYPVTVRVADNGTGNLFDTKSFNVHVNEVNVAPVLNPIGSRTIEEASTLNFTATSSDADLPANNLTFSLVGAPAGASISPAGAFSWTPTELQTPGSFAFTVKVTDDGSPNLSDEEVITVVVNVGNRPPVLNTINNQAGYWGNAFGFTAAASDPDSTDTLTYSVIGAPAGASINPSNGQFAWTPAAAQIGSHTFTVQVTDDGNLDDTQTVTMTVGKRPTILGYTGDVDGQYSDQQSLSAVLTDNGGGAMQGFALSGKTVGLAIGTQNASVSTGGSGTALADFILTQDPNLNYTVASSFAGDSLYLPGSDTDAFDVLQEDARVYYTGTLFVNTACESCSNGTATLSATVKDITAEPSDPAFDSFAGDIRKAKVTFVNRDTNTPLPGCSNLSVGLVNSADPKTGTATCNWNVNIGSSDSMNFTVGIIVDNYYTRNSSADNTVVTISKPISTNFITGGGYLVNSLSNGQYAGANGLKTVFGFNVKYNRWSNTLDGNVLVIVRGSNGRTYLIKGDEMHTLSVQTVTTSPLVREAVYTGMASITDITNPLRPIALGGNNTFQMELTDRADSGNADKIGFTVWNDAGGLLFSSRWDGTRTVEQLLGGGTLVIR